MQQSYDHERREIAVIIYVIFELLYYDQFSE